jgi:hypothetical protein
MDRVSLSRREAALWAGSLLLLAVAVVRLAVPDRSRIRAVSVEGFDIPSEPIAQDQTIIREKTWEPPADVYVLGWNPRVGAAHSRSELVLLDGDVRLFGFLEGAAVTLNQGALPGGTGYLLRKGRRLTVSLRITNTGPASITGGASALVYFVPVEGN